MKTGANRKTAGTDVFLLNEPRPEPLGKVGRTDFAAYPDAERDILDTFVRHRSHLRAEQNAPDLKLLQEKVNRLTRTIQNCRDQIAGFLGTGEDSWTKLEFSAAVSDLLFDQDLDRLALDLVMEETSDDLRKIGVYLSAIKLALEARVSEGEVVEVSSRRGQDDYYRRLHAILLRHSLDGGIGEKSLIVLLVIRLDGKWTQTVRSGPEASREAEIDRRRRKYLAAEIKAAVKPRKGG